MPGSLPSHCTHRLQPLNISCFKSLNTFYDSEIQSWLRQHLRRVVTEFHIAELFCAAYGKAATVKNGTSGFQKAGIYPFRRDLFTEEDFMCSQMTERTDEFQTAVQSTDIQPGSAPNVNQLQTADGVAEPVTSQRELG